MDFCRPLEFGYAVFSQDGLFIRILQEDDYLTIHLCWSIDVFESAVMAFSISKRMFRKFNI